MYGQARTAKKPGTPNIVGVDRHAIGNRCRVVVLPKRDAQGPDTRRSAILRAAGGAFELRGVCSGLCLVA